jgi:aromatic-L-amino-acid/L-tryptophan decarboxylase
LNTGDVMNPEEFRKYGYKVIDWIADYRSALEKFPVMSKSKPQEISASFPVAPPNDPESFDEILNDLNQKILPGITHWNHPKFFAYFPANATLSSVLGDLISTGIGGIGLNWQSMPALTEVEEVVCGWMRQMIGLSPSWEGVIQDTASTSTFVALLCAREKLSNHNQIKEGLQSSEPPLIIYTSTQSHSSVKKAALMAGFGYQNLRSIPTDENFAIDYNLLEEAIEKDISDGLRPCAVVATVGTTATTAIDPISKIAQLTQEKEIWFHVDAAMAGTAMILPECRWMWDGIEQADSMVLNPHKWLGAAFDCSMFYVNDSEHLIRVMSTNPSYLKTSQDENTKSYRDWGIPLGRRFRALKLWCLIRDEGVSGLQARIRKDIENTQWLLTEINATPNWEVLAPVPLQTICMRHIPEEMDANQLETHTLNWVEHINNSGDAYLTPAKLNEKWMVRISIGTEATTLAHIKELWETMKLAVKNHY